MRRLAEIKETGLDLTSQDEVEWAYNELSSFISQGSRRGGNLAETRRALTEAPDEVVAYKATQIGLWSLAMQPYSGTFAWRAQALEALLDRLPSITDEAQILDDYRYLMLQHQEQPSPEGKQLLKRLDSLCPHASDAKLLELMKAGKKPVPSKLLFYAMVKDYPDAVAYGLKHAATDNLIWKTTDELLAPYHERLTAEIDRRFAHGLRKKEREECLDSIQRITGRSLWEIVRTFSEHILLPAAQVMAAGKNPVGPETAHQYHFDSTSVAHDLRKYFTRQAMDSGMNFSQICAHFEALSRTWHHPTIRFAPRGMKPGPDFGIPKEVKRAEPEWYGLLREPFVARNGWRIRNITNEVGLKDAHAKLGHCIDTYEPECRRGGAYLLTIETPDGVLFSTADLRLNYSDRDHEWPGVVPKSQRKQVMINGTKVTVLQHESVRLGGRANVITSGAAHEALEEMLTQAQFGGIQLNLDKHGDTAAYKKAAQLTAAQQSYEYLLKCTGYYPCWENIERAFREYKKDIRAGATDLNEQDRLVYASPKIHLLSGMFTAPGGERFAERDMSVQEWLHASGFWKVIERRMGLAEKPTPPLRATTPPPLTPAQFAHAYNSGTLPKTELARLDATERRHYHQRIQGYGVPDPYFARST